MDNVIIKTNQTTMRFPLGSITAKDIVNAIADVETVKYMDSAPAVYTTKNAEEFLSFLETSKNSDRTLQLGIFENEGNSYIGMCTLSNIDNNSKSCELGYWLSKPYTGKGYAAECATALLQYAKKALEMRTVSAYVITEHKKSIALLERLGFSKIRLLENDIVNKGVPVDRFVYSKELS